MADRKQVMVGIALVFALALTAFGWWGMQRMPDSPYPELGGDFSVQGARGPVALHDFGGKVVLLFFGYTRCPDVCPATMAQVAAALNTLSADEAGKVQALFVSLDAERDTPDLAQRYAQHFHESIIGLSGSPKQVAAAADAFKVGYRKEKVDSALGYVISHSSYLFVLRPDGKVGALLNHSAAAADIAAATRRWLRWAKASS